MNDFLSNAVEVVGVLDAVVLCGTCSQLLLCILNTRETNIMVVIVDLVTVWLEVGLQLIIEFVIWCRAKQSMDTFATPITLVRRT